MIDWPVQARKAGHLEQDGADKQDLHKFADRLHTVLRNPIDTSLLGKVFPMLAHALCMYTACKPWQWRSTVQVL